jgi:putative acyl-CoA dehydrogenase
VARYAAEPAAAVGARRVVETLAVTLQASLLAQHAPAEVADAFVASRVAGGHGHTFGTLEPGTIDGAAELVLERALRL